MRRSMRRLMWIVLVGCLDRTALTQTALTWPEVRARFDAGNPTLRAGAVTIDEARAAEITAYLRPNPTFTFLSDGTQLTPSNGVWRPFAGTLYQPGVSYLLERDGKRELRRDSAQQGTSVAVSQQEDLARTLVFALHNAFVQALQAKAVLAMAKENLDYFDRELAISRDRFRAGDIAQVDLNRLELQRVPYESDYQTAQVNLRTSKIQLLQALNDRTPVEQFDVAGVFDFSDRLPPVDEFRAQAEQSRPDLRAATQAIEKARIDHRLAVANGSTDPTFSAWIAHNPSFNNPYDNNTIGASVSIPLRIFDHNQGEKLRTELEITRTQRLHDAAQAQVFADVGSAYAMLANTLELLRPYKVRYLKTAADVRDTTAFSYQHGQASLLDFLDSQRDYRQIQVAYLNLVGSYLAAMNQLSLAVGSEVTP
jgi:outer membrane protein, heavy metal efflux system